MEFLVNRSAGRDSSSFSLGIPPYYN